LTVISDTSVLIAFESLGKLPVLEEIKKLEERINFRLSRDLKPQIKAEAGE